MCELQRKRNTNSNHQPNTDTTSTEAVEDVSKMTQLLVTWKVKNFEMHKVNVVLVEHDRSLILSEDKLMQLYDKVNAIPSKYYNRKWLIYDGTVLEATYEVVQKEGLELKIVISEGVEHRYTMKPLRINSERQVSSLMAVYLY
jgi:hypothetical protein